MDVEAEDTRPVMQEVPVSEPVAINEVAVEAGAEEASPPAIQETDVAPLEASVPVINEVAVEGGVDAAPPVIEEVDVTPPPPEGGAPAINEVTIEASAAAPPVIEEVPVVVEDAPVDAPDEAAAATLIQAHFKGHLARKALEEAGVEGRDADAAAAAEAAFVVPASLVSHVAAVGPPQLAAA